MESFAPLLMFAAIAGDPGNSTSKEVTVKPFNLAEIGFTEDCNPNEALGRLITLMAGDSNPDLAVYEAVSGEIERDLSFDEPVSWNGLNLIGVHLYFGIERGPVNYSLKFSDAPGTVRMKWNAIGWDLPAVNDSRDVKVLEGYASIGVSAVGPKEEQSRVTCWRD